jgi:hypothetical protein
VRNDAADGSDANDCDSDGSTDGELRDAAAQAQLN